MLQSKSLIIFVMRLLFGFGWLLAGITKVTEKGWFAEPGVFLKDYLTAVLKKPEVPLFYKWFVEEIALEYVLLLNYLIPVVQIFLGIFILVGFLTIPAVITCLIMHINFLLSGNLNLISITLYTSGFLLIIFRAELYHISLDRYVKWTNLDKIRPINPSV